MASSMDDEMHEISLDDDFPPKDRASISRLGTRPDCFRSTFHELCFILCAVFTCASFVILQRATAIMTYLIRINLHMTTSQVTWSTGSSGLTAGAFLLPLTFLFSKISFLSTRTLLLVPLGLFAVVTGLTAVSPTGICFDALSGLAGLACSTLLPSTSGMITTAYAGNLPRKVLVFTFFLAGGPAVSVLVGCLGSGLVATKYSWRASYVFISIVYLLVAALGIYAVPHVPKPNSNIYDDERRTRLRISPDIWISTVLIIVGVSFTTVALTVAPESSHVWKTPSVIALLVIGVVALVALAVWESVTQTPLMPRSLWHERHAPLAMLFTMTSAMGYFSTLFWLPLYLQAVQYLTPFQVAVQLIPQAVAGLFVSPLAGLVLHRVHNSIIMALAAACQVCGSVLLVFLRHNSNYFGTVFPALILSTVSYDLSLNMTSQYIVSKLPLSHHPAGTATLQIMVRLAVPTSLAITRVISSSFYSTPQQLADPMAPYTRAFIGIAAFAGLSLLTVPFTNLGKVQECVAEKELPALPTSTVDSLPPTFGRRARRGYAVETTNDTSHPGSMTPGDPQRYFFDYNSPFSRR